MYIRTRFQQQITHFVVSITCCNVKGRSLILQRNNNCTQHEYLFTVAQVLLSADIKQIIPYYYYCSKQLRTWAQEDCKSIFGKVDLFVVLSSFRGHKCCKTGFCKFQLVNWVFLGSNFDLS